jgi:hypothetical protein
MDNLQKNRDILGIPPDVIDDGDKYTDDEIESILRELYQIAEVCYEYYSSNKELMALSGKDCDSEARGEVLDEKAK